MARLESTLDTRSDTFAANRAAMLERIEAIRALEAGVRAHGERSRGKFDKRGQLMPRERVQHLLDPGAPFLELSTLAGYKMHDDNGRKDVMGGGNVIGIGFVEGIRCLISATDSAIKGGTITPMGLRKSLRAQRIAFDNRLPSISLVESGGANLMYQSELFVEGGQVFCNMARASAAGLPQLTVVHGSSTAGGAYMPGLSDYVVMVRDRAKVFLAGPPLVKAAIGEDAEEEALGGAEMHATITGTAEYLADDDAHAIALARQVLAALPWERSTQATAAERSFSPPRYDIDELAGLVPADPRQPYDAREIIARIVDDSEFLEFKAGFGSDTINGHAAIEGHRVGIIANAGPIQPEGSAKTAHFIQLCCQSNTPLVYLQNTTGFMVGTEAEQGGAVKHGSKMIQAVANATVPQFTIITGGGYGAGNYGMCGRAFDPRFIFAWPGSKVAVMGGDQAATVMEIITRAKFARKGMHLDDAALRQMSDSIRQKLNMEADALFATARVWDDGVIDPRDTRRVLAFCLATCHEASSRTLFPNHFGVARF
jgi:geranyl-CoA carboxylase beta subunit